MKLRFQLDQAACFRRGVDAPKSIVHLEVDPATLNEETRILISRRMVGIDVIASTTAPDGTKRLLLSDSADLDGLIAAAKRDDAAYKGQISTSLQTCRTVGVPLIRGEYGR